MKIEVHSPHLAREKDAGLDVPCSGAVGSRLAAHGFGVLFRRLNLRQERIHLRLGLGVDLGLIWDVRGRGWHHFNCPDHVRMMLEADVAIEPWLGECQ